MMILYLIKFAYSLICYARSTILLSRTNKLIKIISEPHFYDPGCIFSCNTICSVIYKSVMNENNREWPIQEHLSKCTIVSIVTYFCLINKIKKKKKRKKKEENNREVLPYCPWYKTNSSCSLIRA